MEDFKEEVFRFSGVWNQRWLTGAEYQDMLTEYQFYCYRYGFPILEDHPQEIYYTPQNGYIYYLRNQTLKKLGFPRLMDNQKKVYKWKKMNFQTHLPKSRPKVTYIVCSTTGSECSFRMHIVQLARDQNQYLLCHLLQMEPKIIVPQNYIRPIIKLEEPQQSIIDDSIQIKIEEATQETNNPGQTSHVTPMTQFSLPKQDLREKIRCERYALEQLIYQYRQMVHPFVLWMPNQGQGMEVEDMEVARNEHPDIAKAEEVLELTKDV